MPHLTADDGVKLYYEETGTGIPVIFIHEFAGDYRAWEPQVRHFSKSYRCIAYNARGYPPSDVPSDVARYSQDRARDDVRAVLDALKVDTAHVVGLSMGGFAALHFGFTYPQRAAQRLAGWWRAAATRCGPRQGARNSPRKSWRGPRRRSSSSSPWRKAAMEKLCVTGADPRPVPE